MQVSFLTAPSEVGIPDIDQGHAENVHLDQAARGFNSGAIYTNENLGAFNGHIPGSNEVHHGYNQYDIAGQPAFQIVQEEPLAPLVRDLADNNPQSDTLTAFRNLNVDSTPSKSPQTSAASFPPAPIQSPWKTLTGLSTSSIANLASPAPISSWNPEPSPIATPEHKDTVAAAPLPNNADGSPNGAVPENDLDVFPEPQVPVKMQKKTVSPATKKASSKDTLDTAPISGTSIPQLTQSAATVPPVTTPAPQEPSATTAPKAAWAKEEEPTKKKSTAPSISLREIQEAEAKKLELRKAAEREKEKMARASIVVDSKEDIPPFTASWGLPTSQTGSRTSVPIREAAPPAVQTPIAAPVWTTPVKQPTAKKSMKEIQEEEESRKKFAAKEVAVAQAAAKRGYAESTSKVCAIALLSKFLC